MSVKRDDVVFVMRAIASFIGNQGEIALTKYQEHVNLRVPKLIDWDIVERRGELIIRSGEGDEPLMVATLEELAEAVRLLQDKTPYAFFVLSIEIVGERIVRHITDDYEIARNIRANMINHIALSGIPWDAAEKMVTLRGVPYTLREACVTAENNASSRFVTFLTIEGKHKPFVAIYDEKTCMVMPKGTFAIDKAMRVNAVEIDNREVGIEWFESYKSDRPMALSDGA